MPNFRLHSSFLPLLGFLCVAYAEAQNAPATRDDLAKDSKKADAVALDPFVVSTDQDRGYHAANTLNGTRFNSRIKDLGSALTIFTPELLEDLGATNMLDAASFAPSTTRDFGDDADPTGVRSMFFNNLTVRGLNTPDQSRDFFKTGILGDAYNLERLTFMRGANTILFGNAQPGGQNDQQLKRARFDRNLNSVTLKTDSEASYRATVDANFVLLPDKLALRLDGVTENRKSPIKPLGLEQVRGFAAATYRPWASTQIRANIESIDMTYIQGRPYPAFDLVSGWVAAGRPLSTGTVTGNPAAGSGLRRYAANQIVWIDGNAGGGNPIVNALSTTQGEAFTIDGVGADAINTTTARYYSTKKDPAGRKTATSVQTATDTILSVEQRVGENLVLEASYFKERFRRVIDASFSGNNLHVDTNALLPSGAANPNAGRIYTEERLFKFDFRPYWEVMRVTGAYALDFAKATGNQDLGRWLGRHHLAAMYAREKEYTFQDIYTEVNTTPLPGYPADVANSQNIVWRRTYLTDAKGGLATSTDQFGVTFNTGGIATGVRRINPGNNAMNLNQGKLIAGQSFFWHDRLVLNYGLRTDSVKVYTGVTNLKDASGYYVSYDQVTRPTVPTQRFADDTYSAGAVVHALPWLSLSYNQATNFRPPNTAFTTIDNQNLLPPPISGKTQEFSVKMDLLDQRLVLGINQFKTEQKNEISPGYAVTNLMRDANAIWNAVGLLDATAPDGTNRRTGARDTRSYTAEGTELEAVLNLTPGWRLMLNGSHVITKLTAQGTYSRAYIARNLATWQGFKQSTPNIGDGGGGAPIAGTVNGVANQILTIGDLINDINENSQNLLKSIGRRSAQTPEYTANAITSYQFQSGPLQRFRIGGNVQWKSRFVDGYERVGTTSLIVVDRPYYAKGYYQVGLFGGYAQRIMNNKVRWDVQLNVNNLFDKYLVEGAHTMGNTTRLPILTRYNRLLPRTVSLTSRFDF